MLIPFNTIRRDYLSLLGESPDLLPMLGEGEESAVLTLEDYLRVRLPEAAVAATLAADPLFLDEIESFVPSALSAGKSLVWLKSGVAKIRMPADYLKFHSLLMPDWAEPVTATENPASLRGKLGANAPKWMYCSRRPMVVERRDARGICLLVYGCEMQYDDPEECLYVPRPRMEGDELRISAAVYPDMLRRLTERD